MHSCGELSEYAVCLNSTANTTTISGTDILEALQVDTPFYVNVLVLILFALVIRTAAYLALRYLHRPKTD